MSELEGVVVSVRRETSCLGCGNTFKYGDKALVLMDETELAFCNEECRKMYVDSMAGLEARSDLIEEIAKEPKLDLSLIGLPHVTSVEGELVSDDRVIPNLFE